MLVRPATAFIGNLGYVAVAGGRWPAGSHRADPRGSARAFISTSASSAAEPAGRGWPQRPRSGVASAEPGFGVIDEPESPELPGLAGRVGFVRAYTPGTGDHDPVAGGQRQ